MPVHFDDPPYPEYSIRLARRLRQEATPAEELFWQAVRNRKLAGLKFRRQHHVERYIVDFYCHELNLVVELEGDVHQDPEQRAYDEVRFETLGALGLNIIRVSNEDVLLRLSSVLGAVAALKSKR